jgi:hypothetical protein
MEAASKKQTEREMFIVAIRRRCLPARVGRARRPALLS